MRKVFAFFFSLFLIFVFAGQSFAKQTQASPAASGTAASAVPHLIKFSGTLLDSQGQPLKSPVGVTFSLYAQQSGDAPLWMETQNVELDAKGRYTVLLGANSAMGLPEELFRNGEARWLGIQPEREPELPRVLLVSVPYALKAGDAQTLGGLPPSAFAPAGLNTPTNPSSPSSTPAPTVLSPSFAAGVNSASLSATTCTTITADGTATANLLAKFTGGCQIHQSVLFDNGTNVGIGNGTTAPAAKLDVFGTGMFRGALTLPSINTASPTNTAGFTSQPFDLLASVWNTSGTPVAVSEHFRWQVQPVGSNTTSPSGSLNLLFASGTGTPAQTGLSISSKGIITFATGQTLPPLSSLTVTGNVTAKQFVSTAVTGTAPFVVSSTSQVTNLNASLLNGFPASHFGTITGITTAVGSGLQGGVTTGIATLSLIKTCTSGQVLSWNGTAWGCATVATTGVNTFIANNSTQVVSVIQNGTGSGLAATTASATGSAGAVNGTATAAAGNGRGVIGSSFSSSGGIGVLGEAGAFGAPGNGVGVEGISLNSTGIGVEGTGAIGVEGLSFSSSTAAGVFNNSGGGKLLSGQAPVAACSPAGWFLATWVASSGETGRRQRLVIRAAVPAMQESASAACPAALTITLRAMAPTRF
jgi:hypothetical protein